MCGCWARSPGDKEGGEGGTASIGYSGYASFLAPPAAQSGGGGGGDGEGAPPPRFHVFSGDCVSKHAKSTLYCNLAVAMVAQVSAICVSRGCAVKPSRQFCVLIHSFRLAPPHTKWPLRNGCRQDTPAKLVQAQKLVEQALAATPDASPALLIAAYLELRAQNTEGALLLLKRRRPPPSSGGSGGGRAGSSGGR
jgi:hypothetical protein